MSQPTAPPTPEPDEPGTGLEDPRVIHPSPGEVAPEVPEAPADDDATRSPEPTEGRTSGDEEPAPGISDPRLDRFGPDL